MSDPKRLRELPGDDFAASLLRGAAPTSPMRAEDLARLDPAVARIASAPPWYAVVAVKYGAHALVALSVVSAVVLGARAQGTLRGRVAAPPAAVVETSAPPPVALTPPAPTAVVSPPSPEVSPVERTPSRAARRASPTPRAAPPLSEELAVMRAARAALPDAPARAFALLRDAEARLRGGQLADERAALAIESLVRAGRRGEAESRLRSFERATHDGPQLARLRALLRASP